MLIKSENHTHTKISQFKMGADGKITKGCSQVVAGGITSGQWSKLGWSEFNNYSSTLYTAMTLGIRQLEWLVGDVN